MTKANNIMANVATKKSGALALLASSKKEDTSTGKGKKSKEVVLVDEKGFGDKLNRYAQIKKQEDNLKAEKASLHAIIQEVGREKFLEDYKKSKKTPENFIIGAENNDGTEKKFVANVELTPEAEVALTTTITEIIKDKKESAKLIDKLISTKTIPEAKVMFIPMDKYLKLTPESEAVVKELVPELVDEKVVFTVDSEYLEIEVTDTYTNEKGRKITEETSVGAVLARLINTCPAFSQKIKDNLLKATETTFIKKGAINELGEYENLEVAYQTIQVIEMLKLA